jgi:hypothetical protein
MRSRSPTAAEPPLLAQHSLQELHGLGDQPRRPPRSGPGALTPTEERVVQLAARGLTTARIAPGAGGQSQDRRDPPQRRVPQTRRPPARRPPRRPQLPFLTPRGPPDVRAGPGRAATVRTQVRAPSHGQPCAERKPPHELKCRNRCRPLRRVPGDVERLLGFLAAEIGDHRPMPGRATRRRGGPRASRDPVRDPVTHANRRCPLPAGSSPATPSSPCP